MPNCSRSLLVLLVVLAIIALFVSSSKGEITDRQNVTQSRITYLNINVELTGLDLEARRIGLNLSVTMGLNFNASQSDYYAMVATIGTGRGLIRLVNVTRGLNSSVFQTYGNESGFTGYFWGGPESYPFDRYKFNFTLSFLLENVSLSEDNVTFSYNVDWPLRAEFNEPSENFTSVAQSAKGPIVSVGYVLDRPEWRGYSTLLPIYLIFALLGFSTFIKIHPDKLTQRIAVYTAVLTSTLAYSISVQNVLPSGRYYLSIPEAMTYGIIASAAIFIISTLTACRFKVSQILADTIAAITSQAFLSFLLLTFYFAKYVEIDSHQFARILSTQWIVMGLVFIGVIMSAISDFLTFLKNSKGSENLRKERLDYVVRRTYWVSFFLELCTACIVAYERFIQANFEMGMLRNLVVSLAGNNVLLMILYQVALWSAYLCIIYLFSKRARYSLLKDSLGFSLLFLSMFNFLTSFLLSFGSLADLLILTLILTAECSFSFWMIRRKVKTPYEQLVSWLGE